MSTQATTHLPHDAIQRVAHAADRREQPVVLKFFLVLTLLFAGLVLFVPFWLEAVRDLAQATHNAPWGLIRGAVLGGVAVVIALLAGLVATWARLLKHLARTDWDA